MLLELLDFERQAPRQEFGNMESQNTVYWLFLLAFHQVPREGVKFRTELCGLHTKFGEANDFCTQKQKKRKKEKKKGDRLEKSKKKTRLKQALETHRAPQFTEPCGKDQINSTALPLKPSLPSLLPSAVDTEVLEDINN